MRRGCMIAKVRHGRTRGTSHSPGCGSSDFVSLRCHSCFCSTSSLFCTGTCTLYTILRAPAPCTVYTTIMYRTNPQPPPARVPTSNFQPNYRTRALTGPALSLRRLCYLQQSGTHSTRCACKRDELICVRVRQSNRAVAAATRVSFQRRPIANVRRDFGTVRFVASRIDLRFSSVAIGHMIS